MHMSDALISPAVGGLGWAVTTGVLGYCTYRLRNAISENPVARMGIMGAFVFASQMINFTIPGTGSSGHLSGALLLAIVLGPWAAFLTMALVILVQALFFADGGILAWGVNVLNMGLFAIFLAYPLVFKPIAGSFQNKRRVFAASVVAAVVSLQLGAFAVVIETLVSGISALPFKTFVILMQPIHLAISIVEGVVTGGVVVFLAQSSPEIFRHKASNKKSFGRPWIIIAVATVLTASMLSWFASQNPDGLEWSIGKTAGKEEIEGPASAAHSWFSKLQQTVSFLPDYSFPKKSEIENEQNTSSHEESWPSVDTGTSLSGIVGGALVFLLTVAWALASSIFRNRKVT